MFIVDVIPLIKIPLQFPQTLTYFYKEKLPTGSLVLIPIFKGETRAIVQKCWRLEEKKLEIKKKDFQLKGIAKILSLEPIISKKQLTLAQWIYEYYLASFGMVLRLFLPSAIIKRKKLPQISSIAKQAEQEAVSNMAKKKLNQPLVVWGKERASAYLKEINQTIKNKKQVIILVPETQDAEEIISKLNLDKTAGSSKPSIAVIGSELKAPKKLQEWQKIRTGQVDIIIGTRSAIFAPCPDLGLIIIDKEESSNYKSWDQHPRYDAKTIALKLAESNNIKLILGTELPSVESYHWLKQEKYKIQKLLKPDSPQEREIQIIDMKEEIKKGNYSIFSDTLQDALKENLKKGKQAILFINRRGLATSVFCRDCGYVIKCNKCAAPMAYHKIGQKTWQKNKKAGKEFLLCHHCGSAMDSPAACPGCGGWRIKYSGTGTQKVVEELKKLADSKWQNLATKIKIARIDSDTTPKPEDQKKILIDFKNKKFDILVGTQLLLKYKTLINNKKDKQQKPDIAGVIFIDSILNLPEYRAEERVFQILQRLQGLAKKTLIQTYRQESPVFNFLQKNDIRDFLENELKNRKAFFYPPFSQIIKLTYSSKNPVKAKKEASELAAELSSLKYKLLGPAPGFISKVKDEYVWNLLLKIKTCDSETTSQLMELVSKDWTVDVDPESLL